MIFVTLPKPDVIVGAHTPLRCAVRSQGPTADRVLGCLWHRGEAQRTTLGQDTRTTGWGGSHRPAGAPPLPRAACSVHPSVPILPPPRPLSARPPRKAARGGAVSPARATTCPSPWEHTSLSSWVLFLTCLSVTKAQLKGFHFGANKNFHLQRREEPASAGTPPATRQDT